MKAHEAYASFYAEMKLERAGPFARLRETYGGETVLYPGSNIHVTPSFFFPHVIYVDRHPSAREFFAQDVLGWVSRRRTYKRSTYLRYLDADYTQPLPLPEASFDWLFALHAGQIARSCQRYVKTGGLLVSNNFQDDAGEAFHMGGWQLIATVHENGTRHTVDLDTYFVPAPVRTKAAPPPWPIYTRQANYYVFRRTSASI